MVLTILFMDLFLGYAVAFAIKTADSIASDRILSSRCICAMVYDQKPITDIFKMQGKDILELALYYYYGFY